MVISDVILTSYFLEVIMNIKRKFCFAFTSIIFAANLSAQSASMESKILYGNAEQSGFRLHTLIDKTISNGMPKSEAIGFEVSKSIIDEDVTIDGNSKVAISTDIPLAYEFYEFMVVDNSLIDTVKHLMDEYPDKAVEIVYLAIYLYPSYSRDIYDGAFITGLISQENLITLFVETGYDPTLLVKTSSGSSLVKGVPYTPVGAGNGAGGSGGGDTTASSN